MGNEHRLRMHVSTLDPTAINNAKMPQKFLLNYDYGRKDQTYSGYQSKSTPGTTNPEIPSTRRRVQHTKAENELNAFAKFLPPASRPKTQEKNTRRPTLFKRPIEMLAKRFSSTKIESEQAQ